MTTVFTKGVDPGTAGASGVMGAADRVKLAAQQQMAWNRPNTTSPWASQYSDPSGAVRLGFTGPLADAQQNLTAEALRNMSSPTDFSQFNTASGDDFRNQGIAQAQGQMSDWLGPLQGGLDDAAKQRAVNAGYDPNSSQFQAQLGKGAGTAADMRSTVANQAIGMGGQMGAKLGAMDLLAKQQGLAEALRKRSLPMEQLGAMRGLLEQPGVNGDSSIMAGATGDLGQYLKNYLGKRGDYEAQNESDQQAGLGAGLSLFNAAASLGTSGFGSLGKKSGPANPSVPYGSGPVGYT